LIKEHHPKLVILDIMMPGKINGLELCRFNKENIQLQATKVILLSAKGPDSDIDEGLDAGADDYITKPFSPSVLAVKVKQLMDVS
jgi:DNA-binding response OmpR family regulator